MMKFNHIWLSNIIVGAVVLGVSLRRLEITLGVLGTAWLLVNIVSGVTIMSGLIIMIGTLNFRFVRGGAIGNTIFYSFSELVRFPITIYPHVVQLLVTVIPFAFINFYPSQLFLARSGDQLFSPAFRYGAPLVAAISLGLGVVLWNGSIRHYQSTGS